MKIKAWYIAAGVLGLAVLYILIKRPAVPIGPTMQAAGGNDLYRAIGALAGLGTVIVGKVGAPSAVAGNQEGVVTTDSQGRIINDPNIPNFAF